MSHETLVKIASPLKPLIFLLLYDFANSIVMVGSRKRVIKLGSQSYERLCETVLGKLTSTSHMYSDSFWLIPDVADAMEN